MALQKLPVAVLVLLLLPLTAGMSFNVKLSAVTEHRAVDVGYTNNVTDLQEINASIENTGSIGCRYRLKASFDLENHTENQERYSPAYALFPGDGATARIKYLPYNYTGPVDTNLSIEYCGQHSKVDRFRFNVTNRTVTNKTLKSTTLEAGPETARIQVSNSKKGLLVPLEAPPYWKTTPVNLRNGNAKLDYEPPIFQSRETVSYALLNETTGALYGTTKVKLEPEPTLGYRVSKNFVQLLFAASLLLNLIMAALLLNRRK